jgi:hypothetical protein
MESILQDLHALRQMLAEKDAAIAERERVIAEKDALLTERDHCRSGRGAVRQDPSDRTSKTPAGGSAKSPLWPLFGEARA